MGGKNYCLGCKYYMILDGVNRYCNYMAMEGHARSLICPPGKDCTVKSKGAYKVKRMGSKIGWEETSLETILET